MWENKAVKFVPCLGQWNPRLHNQPSHELIHQKFLTLPRLNCWMPNHLKRICCFVYRPAEACLFIKAWQMWCCCKELLHGNVFFSLSLLSELLASWCLLLIPGAQSCKQRHTCEVIAAAQNLQNNKFNIDNECSYITLWESLTKFQTISFIMNSNTWQAAMTS